MKSLIMLVVLISSSAFADIHLAQGGPYIPHDYLRWKAQLPDPSRAPKDTRCLSWKKIETYGGQGSVGPHGSSTQSSTGDGITYSRPQWICQRYGSLDLSKQYSRYARLNCGGLTDDQCLARFVEEQQLQQEAKELHINSPVQEASIQELRNGQR